MGFKLGQKIIDKIRGKKFIKKISANLSNHIEYPTDNEGNIILGLQALHKFIDLCKTDFEILDIGCGKKQLHSKIMRQNKLNPSTCDFYDDCIYKGFYENVEFKEGQFDAIWCCHVLEHVLNTGQFLQKINHDIKDDGILCITVPPLKNEIVGGHVNLFNSGLLIYRLILSGFDCSEAIVGEYDYNISVILKVKKISELPTLNYDKGDIEILAKYFPFKARQNFLGTDLNINWSM